MKYIEFFQSLRELRMTISDSFLPLCYCIYLSKDLKTCVVKWGLSMWDMTDVSCFILVGVYRWQNFTYTNTKSVLLGFFNDKLEPVNSIVFDKLELTDISFYGGDMFNPYQLHCPCYYIKDTRTGKDLKLNKDYSLENFQQVLNCIWEEENKE